MFSAARGISFWKMEQVYFVERKRALSNWTKVPCYTAQPRSELHLGSGAKKVWTCTEATKGLL
jgi:hypothetical protein